MANALLIVCLCFVCAFAWLLLLFVYISFHIFLQTTKNVCVLRSFTSIFTFGASMFRSILRTTWNCFIYWIVETTTTKKKDKCLTIVCVIRFEPRPRASFRLLSFSADSVAALNESGHVKMNTYRSAAESSSTATKHIRRWAHRINRRKKNKETLSENKTIKCMLKVFNGLNRCKIENALYGESIVCLCCTHAHRRTFTRAEHSY